MNKDTITLEFTGYIIKGYANLLLWGDGEGEIIMDNYALDEITPKNIWDNANDAGFGCQKITKIRGSIYKSYEGHLHYLEDFEIKEEDI